MAPRKIYKRTCAECGAGFESTNPRHASGPTAFCCAEHRVAFNNRRQCRGGQLYDLIMSKRYDRANEREARLLIDRVAAAARDADKALRDGRPSWLPFEHVKQNIPLGYGSNGDGR